jgi:hypothetical protein
MVNRGRYPQDREARRIGDPGMTVGVWERIKEALKSDWEQTKEDFGLARPRGQSDVSPKPQRITTSPRVDARPSRIRPGNVD